MVPVKINDYINLKHILMMVEPKQTNIISYKIDDDIEPFLQQYFLNRNCKYAEVNIYENGFNIMEMLETDFNYKN